MNQALQTKAEYSKNTELIKVVRDTIFPESSDSELALFFFKCQSVGVHPLEKMIIPVKYDGKISFISTIDFFRSQSEESGDYDGMDQIEYEGEETETYDGTEYTHPIVASCRVYRKGINRPFVGEARWREFYPGHRKGFMWRKMGYAMLGKCAEAQARRLAWPKKLNKLYTEEELQNNFEALADGSSSKKPNVSPDEVTVYDNPTDQSALETMVRPNAEERKAGKLISEKQGFLMFKECQKRRVNHETVASVGKAENIFWLTTNKDEKYNYQALLNTVKTNPQWFTKVEQGKGSQKPKEGPRSEGNGNQSLAMDHGEFSTLIESLAIQAGISVEAGLKECLEVDMLDDVLPELQNKAIDFFTAKADEQQAGA